MNRILKEFYSRWSSFCTDVSGPPITNRVSALFHYPQWWFGDAGVLNSGILYPIFVSCLVSRDIKNGLLYRVYFPRPIQRVHSCVDFYWFLSSPFWIFDFVTSLFVQGQFAANLQWLNFRKSICYFHLLQIAVSSINNVGNDANQGNGYNSPLYGSIFLILTGVETPGLICKCTVPFVKTWLIL